MVSKPKRIHQYNFNILFKDLLFEPLGQHKSEKIEENIALIAAFLLETSEIIQFEAKKIEITFCFHNLTRKAAEFKFQNSAILFQ